MKELDDLASVEQSSMQAAVAAAKAKIPVGGSVPRPPIPRLDQIPSNPHAGVQSAKAFQRILSPEEQKALAERGQFVSGVGSAYAVNQPTRRPISDDEHPQEIDPRLTPRPPGSGLRENTIKDLEAIATINSKQPSDDEALNKINKDIEEVDDTFETNDFGERVRSTLHNKKRKEFIEGRCPPLSFEDLLLYGSVNQKVPIIPGKFEPTFRSLQGDENVEILRMMGSVRGPDQYILDTLSIYNLTAGLYAINGKILPNHLDKNGEFNEEMFRAKYRAVAKMSSAVLNDLSVNFGWFNKRVEKLMVVDDIKGF